MALPLACTMDDEAGRAETSACEQLYANVQACFGAPAPLDRCDESSAAELLELSCEELDDQGAKDDGFGCDYLPFLPWCTDDEPSGGDGVPQAWPNEHSKANSDPWIAANHQLITQMRPRVLALNFVNARSMAQMQAQLTDVRDIIAESTRWRGYDDPSAPTFLEYELAYTVDMRDSTPPPGWTLNNSSLYPREDPVEGAWSFDYEKLFTEEYAQYYRIEDPEDPGTSLRLCEAIERGLVHEVWIYGNADMPDVSAAEVLELKPRYDEDGNRRSGAMDRCAGNGCFDEEDVIPCGRSIRVAWFNDTRGPGCFLEGVSHAFEGMGRRGSTVLPYLERYFSEFSGMELDTEYRAPVSSWYQCHYGSDCLTYTDESTVEYAIRNDAGAVVHEGTIEDYDPVCGSVHWAPNGRLHYDMASTAAVRTSCTHWRDGSGQTELYDGSQHRAYDTAAPDCMGSFLMWWRQNIPGYANTLIDDDGQPMLNWWPFLFY
ncbi:MAG: hypothetical protein AB1Z98_24900 [Nannocystaceae bacterium]